MKDISTRSFLIITIFVAIISSTVFAALNNSLIKSEVSQSIIDDSTGRSCGHVYNVSSPTCTVAKKCEKCGYVAYGALGHNYEYKYSTTSHWRQCSRCGSKLTVESHLYKSNVNTCAEDMACMICGYVKEAKTGHVYYNSDNYDGNVYKHKNYSYHWKECSKCGNVAYKESHMFSKNGICNICGYICEHKDESKNVTETLVYTDKNESKHIETITCTRCKKYLRENEKNHIYVGGVCICGRKANVECKEHKFEDGVCIDCGYECQHTITYERADNISKTQHTLKSICKDCGMQVGTTSKEAHIIGINGMCEKCLYYTETIQCSHEEWTAGICDKCGFQCEHNGKKEYSYDEKRTGEGVHYRITKCLICGENINSDERLPHNFEKNGKCECGYECKHSKTYEKAEYANKNYHTLKIVCEKCGEDVSKEKTSHNFDEKGNCTKCTYACSHKYGSNVTYESNGDKHIETKKCTNCNATISEGEQEHKFSSGKCILCKQKEKCSHTSTKTEFVVAKEMVHTEKTICNLCGDIIKTNQVSANTDFDAIYTPTSEITHKFNLKCKTCDFTYEGNGNCSFDMVTHKCDFCTNKLTICNDTTHKHNLICDEGVTIPHTLYYYCEKYSLRWEATEKNNNAKIKYNLALQSNSEYVCEVCAEVLKLYSKNEICNQHQPSIIKEYKDEKVHVVKIVCKVCNKEISKTEQKHQINSTIKYKNETMHIVTEKCTVCGYEESKEESHKKLKQVKIIEAVEEKHKLLMNCSECGHFIIEEDHKQDSQGKCTVCGVVLINSDEVIKAKKLNVSLSDNKLKVGEIIDLQDSLSVSPEGAKTNLQWSATNDNVTLKANGRLTANKAGSTTIKVTDTISGKTASVIIKIESNKSSTSTETKNTTFNDVEKDSWYNEVVQKATKENIFNGVTENEFAPNDYITRGMFVTALARVDKIDVAGYANLFSDVDDEIYYADSIKWASVYGIVNGIGDGKFAPDELMTREEMAVMIHNYIDSQYKNVYIFNMSDEENVSQFNDDDEISSWASVAVNELADMGIINGNENGNFAPKDNVTRAEAAAVLVRLSEKTKVN